MHKTFGAFLLFLRQGQAQSSLESEIFLLQTLKCWNCRHEQPYQIYKTVF